MNMNLRNLLGLLAANTFIASGLVKRATKMALNSECILSIYFHKPTKTEFESCVKWLKEKGFTFLSVHDIERIIRQELPFPKGSVLLTADDGWQSNVGNIVEVANRYQVPVTIFVPTTPVEEGAYWWSYLQKARQSGVTTPSKKALKKMPEEKRFQIMQEIKKKVSPQREAMGVEQLKAISNSAYVTIGSHTQTHPVLINCDEVQVYEELDLSRQKLESWINKEVVYFAYPNGDYSMREVQILKSLNYRVAFSSEPKYLTPDLLGNNFTLPRFGFLDGASFSENICRITGVWQPLMIKWWHSGVLKFKIKNRTAEADKKASYFGLRF